MNTCYCVTYNGHRYDKYFYIKNVFYGKYAKNKATEYALKLNIEDLEEYLEDFCEEDDRFKEVRYLKMLKDETSSVEKRLEDYVRLLDYSNGNFKYDSNFYNITRCKIEID